MAMLKNPKVTKSAETIPNPLVKQCNYDQERYPVYQDDKGPTPSKDNLPIQEAAGLADTLSDEARANLIIHLQHTYGNGYVQRMVNSLDMQTKLNVSAPSDIYEQEANRIADNLNTPMQPQAQRAEIPQEEETLQRKPDNDRVESESNNTESRISADQGGGEPLSDIAKKPLEHVFGIDFSQVRIHTDPEADSLNRELNAKAFTTGSDIFFRQGEYNPASQSGQRLIAHELAHVVQQSNSRQTEGIAQRALEVNRTPVAAAEKGRIEISPATQDPYDVSGNTLEEVLDQLDPDEWGRCTWTWHQSIRTTEGVIDRANISLGLRIRLPRWRGRGWRRASEPVKAEWNRMLESLRAHENRHAEIARSWAPQLQDLLLNQPESEQSSIWTNGLASHETAQSTYDADTSHGQTEGVTLDTTIGQQQVADEQPSTEE
jgi:hypothetical protein